MTNINEDSGSSAKEIPVRVAEKTPRQNREEFSQLMQEPRFWATTAHAMGPLMFLLWMLGDGPAWLFPLAITAGIYFYHQQKSALVRHHARQALTLQLLGSFGWMALLLSGFAIWIIALMMSLVLVLVLVGLLLTPIVLVAGPMFFLLTLLLPLSAFVLGLVGAWETWQGRDFRYPYLADWLDNYLGQNSQKAITLV
jgi:uncharacterized membrane protein